MDARASTRWGLALAGAVLGTGCFQDNFVFDGERYRRLGTAVDAADGASREGGAVDGASDDAEAGLDAGDEGGGGDARDEGGGGDAADGDGDTGRIDVALDHAGDDVQDAGIDARGDRGFDVATDEPVSDRADAAADGGSEGGADAGRCPMSQERCGAECALLASDLRHCGRCGNACTLANATAMCASGRCALATCAPGSGNCDGDGSNGCEVDLSSAAAHCGACGRACSAGSHCARGACGPTHAWSQRFGGPQIDIGLVVTTDVAGNVYFGGNFSESVDFGGRTMRSAGPPDAIVASFSAGGAFRWAQRFGGGSFDNVSGIARTSAGLYVSGLFTGAADFGGRTLTSAGGTDIFLVHLSADTGELRWARRFGGLQDDSGSLTADGAGNLFLAGSFQRAIDFGGGPLAGAGEEDVYLAALDPAGAHRWSRRYGRAATEVATGLAVDRAGNITLVGTFTGQTEFGGALLTSAGGTDVFVAGLNTRGDFRWADRWGSSGSDFGNSIALDPGGNVQFAGSFEDTVDFGGGPLASAGQSDGFVASFSSTGMYRWARRFGSDGPDRGLLLAADALGNVFLAGECGSRVDFGGGFLAGGGICAASFTGGGHPRWSRHFGDDTNQGFAHGIAVGADEAVFLTGIFGGAVNFGGGRLFSAGLQDGFVLRLSQ